MTSRLIIWVLIGVWLFGTAIVIGYPLRTGQIRVGFDPVSREAAPKAFWTAYIISTVLFIAVSVAVAFFVKAILPPLVR